MDTYKIAVDTFLAETSECKASGCAVFTGADIAFQDIQLHTHRNKSELHFMAGHTMLSIPLASILSIEKLVQGMYVPAQRCVCCILFRPLPAFSDPYQPSVPALSEGP